MLSGKVTFLRISSALVRAGISRATLYERQARSLFPRLVRVGDQAVAIIEAELDTYLEAQTLGATDEELRALVKALIRARADDDGEAQEILEGLRARMRGNAASELVPARGRAPVARNQASEAVA